MEALVQGLVAMAEPELAEPKHWQAPLQPPTRLPLPSSVSPFISEAHLLGSSICYANDLS